MRQRYTGNPPKNEDKKSNIERFYDQRAGAYGEMITKAEYPIPKWVQDNASSVQGDSVLDLACGTGNLGAALSAGRSGFELYGADLSGNMVEQAQLRGIYREVVQQDLARGLPSFAKVQTYDLVMALGFMEFLAQPEALLSQIVRQLNSSGRVWFSLEKTAPDSQASGEIRPALGFAMYHYCEAEVLRIAEKSELQVLSIIELGSYLRSYDKKRVPWWLIQAQPKATP